MAKNKYNAHSVRPCKGGGILVEGTFDTLFQWKPYAGSFTTEANVLKNLVSRGSSMAIAVSRHTEMAGLMFIASNPPNKQLRSLRA
jgi:hypothetical protein